MDSLSKSERSERMSRVKSKDTKPELAVRRLVHSLGYRYRLHPRDVPGKPDICFRNRRKLIFVQGCFWHRHQDVPCKLARLPKTRVDFWQSKLDANRSRDDRVHAQLEALGWSILLVWECELGQWERLKNKIELVLREPEDEGGGTVRGSGRARHRRKPSRISAASSS